jgi:SAM-dependent methyltransferase/uncharacterized protein YbaR (Trm112 family)
MRPRLLDILVCPLDKTPLQLLEWESSWQPLSNHESSRAKRAALNPESLSREITTGVLLNLRRKIFYPIYLGIPRMTVFPTAVGETFGQRYAQRIRDELPGFGPANERPMPGEQDVLRTFSSEWLNYDWDNEVYWNLTPREMYRCMRFMLDLDRRPIKDKLVLEIGIGIGGIADYMARDEECELVGIDLSYTVDVAYKHFQLNKFFHVVQASAFAPPFLDETFDFVYSQGVLHHTFSTKEAFKKVYKLPKIGGRLYIWVYNPLDETRNMIRRILMLGENIIRPICWRLPESLQTVLLTPFIPLYIFYQNFIVQRKGKNYVKYGWREALHAARDRFTPRFVHRHGDEEVMDWFRHAGYGDLQSVRQRQRPEFLPEAFWTATAIDGVRLSARWTPRSGGRL